MNKHFFFSRYWPAAALAAGLCLGAPAAQAQTIASSAALSFGAFVAGMGGSVAVAPNGARGKSGGVMLIPQGGGATAAQFTVSGTASATYAISLPADGTVALLDGNSHGMALNGFASYPSATGTLSVGGTQMLSVGATLTVGGSQPPGSYAGAFPVTVNYN